MTTSTSSLDRLFSQPGIDDPASAELLTALSSGSRGTAPREPDRYAPPERPPALRSPAERTERDGPGDARFDPLGGGFFGPEGNNPPDAVEDNNGTDEDTPVTIDVLENDSDPDGDPLAVVSASAPTNGSVSINPDNTVTYVPNPGWHGLDQFTYTISDGFGGTDTADVWLLVESVNDWPVALDGSFTIVEDTGFSIDLLFGSTDPDGDRLTLLDISEPLYGKLTLNDNDTVTYQPNGDFNSLDVNGNLTVQESFTFTIWDGLDGESTGLIVITVAPVQDVPFVYDDALVIGLVSTDPPEPAQASFGFDILLRNDIDYDYRDPNYNLADWDVIDISGPVDIFFEDRYFIYYVPPIEGCEVVQETISYTVSDGTDTATATAYIFLTPICACPPDDPDCPMEPPPLVATDDEVVVDGESVSDNVLSNDEYASLAILETVPAVGRLAPFSSGGSFTYLADVNFRGEVSGLFWLNPQTGYVAATTVVYLAYAEDGRAAGANLQIVAPQADLDIDEMDVVSEKAEDVVGGLVVAINNDPIYGWNNIPGDNNDPAVEKTPRKKIIIQPVEPGNWRGNVVLTDPGSRADIFDSKEGGNKIIFNGTDNKFPTHDAQDNPLLPKELWVLGRGYSTTMRDLELKVEAEGIPRSADTVRFTVLHTEAPVVKFSATDSVSDNNVQKPRWEQTSTATPKVADLGPSVRFRINQMTGNVTPTSTKQIGWGYEVRAEVHPHDFDYPGAFLLLDRDVYSRGWKSVHPSNNQTEVEGGLDYKPIKLVPDGNDTSDVRWWLDTEPAPSGFVFDLDIPAFDNGPMAINTILRARFNARSFVSVDLNLFNDDYIVRAGWSRQYYVRFSIIRRQNYWEFIKNATVDGWVDGDHDADYGTTEITWNLQPPPPPP